MDSQNLITLPKKRQTRTLVFGIRLTQQERETIRAFANASNSLPRRWHAILCCKLSPIIPRSWRRKATWMQRSPDAVQEEKPENTPRRIDMLSVCRAVLRVVARLEESDYTGEKMAAGRRACTRRPA